jgi:hypothetical protein
MVKLTETDRQKLEKFLTRIASETYPEPITPLHAQITKKMWNTIKVDLPSLAGLEIRDTSGSPSCFDRVLLLEMCMI